MITTEHPCRTITVDELPEASLAEVLLYGLTLDDDNPALGVLLAVRREIGVVAALAENGQYHADFDLGELAPVLEGIGRRLDVAIELFTRAQRTSIAATPAEPEGAGES